MLKSDTNPYVRRISTILLILALSMASAQAEDIAGLLGQSGVKGGVVVHLGCGDATDTVKLRAGDQYVVHGLDTDAKSVAKARERLLADGQYGPVSLDVWNGKALPYTDNFVNLIVAEKPGEVTESEFLRALAPNGVAMVKREGKWTKLAKPWPKEMDHWTHYFHGPEGNPTGKDTLVGPPKRLQWLGSPGWSRHHDHMASLSAMVSANGRLFYIFDEGSLASIRLPSHWKLIARDAFNGTILWKRNIPRWVSKEYGLKSGPAHLLRRLVAVGDRVYVTLGIDAPVSVLDAATGKTLQTLEGSAFTSEILVANKTVLALGNKAKSKLPDFQRVGTYVWSNTRTSNSRYAWNGVPRIIRAYGEDGSKAWEKEFPVAPCSLAANTERVAFHTGKKLVCLDLAKGGKAWESAPVAVKVPVHTNTGIRVLIYKDRVLLAGNNGKMSGWSLADGKKVWEVKKKPSGHMSLKDLFVAQGLAWTAAIAQKNEDGTWIGYDALTGEKKREFKADVKLHWFHHRCYPCKATEKFILAGRNGTEYVDLGSKHWTPNHWVRGGCIYGVMPCNGITYAPMDSCGCQLEAKLSGLKALGSKAAPKPSAEELASDARLQKGPAYGKANGTAAGAADWPTYRHDIARSGATSNAVSGEGAPKWEAKLGGRLTAPSSAAGKIFIASRDTHTVHALDASTGRQLWHFTTGGQTDTPPTYHKGMLLFGSADGYVYAVNAEDGALAWRFRAAPLDQRLMAWESIESAWPVHGSVLVRDGVIYCTAGRSIYLDGGIRFLRLEAETGKLLGEQVWDELDPNSKKTMHNAYLKRTPGNNMPVGLSDVLSCNGKDIWMRSQKINFEGKRSEIALVSTDQQPAKDGHLFCQIGLTDDSYFFRSYWMYGRRTSGGYSSWFKGGRRLPSGRILCFDDKAVYGYGRHPAYMVNASMLEYRLFAARKAVTPEDIKKLNQDEKKIDKRRRERSAVHSDWQLRWHFKDKELTSARFDWVFEQPAVFTRALCGAGDVLYVAGPPDLIDEREAYRKPRDPEVLKRIGQQEAAYANKLGAQLWAVNKADGKPQARHKLDAVPVFDGMVVAGGRLIMSTTDGRVLSLSKPGIAALPSLSEEPAQVSWGKPEDPKYLLPEGAIKEKKRRKGGKKKPTPKKGA